MAYLWVESVLCLAAGVLFLLASFRIQSSSRGKPQEARRANFAYAFLWLTAGAGSFLLMAANVSALMEWRTLDDAFSAASAVTWGMAVIPFLYISAYLILQSVLAARIAGACGGLLLAVGVWMAFEAPKRVVEEASRYFINIIENPWAQVYTVGVVVVPGVIASVYLYETGLRLEGAGRWRSLMGTVAMDVYIISMLTRVAWQALAANLVSRALLLVSAVLIFLAYHYTPPGLKEGGEGEG